MSRLIGVAVLCLALATPKGRAAEPFPPEVYKIKDVRADLLVFAPHGKTLAVIDLFGDPQVFNAPRKERTLQGEHKSGAAWAVFDSDGSKLYTCGSGGHLVRWDVENGPGGEGVLCQGHRPRPQPPRAQPRRKTLAASGEDKVLRLYDAATGKERKAIADFTTSRKLSALAFSPDGKRLIVTDGNLKSFDPDTGKAGETFSDYDTGGGVAFSPDGKTLLLEGMNRFSLWEFGAAKVKIRVPVGKENACLAAAFCSKAGRSRSPARTARCGSSTPKRASPKSESTLSTGRVRPWRSGAMADGSPPARGTASQSGICPSCRPCWPRGPRRARRRGASSRRC